jgi:hypothetical protein
MSAAIAESPPEHVRTATPARRERCASALCQLEQLSRILGDHGAGLATQRGKHAMVAGDRTRVRLGSRGCLGRCAGLKHDDTHVSLGALCGLCTQLGSVADRIEIERDRAHLLIMGEPGNI